MSKKQKLLYGLVLILALFLGFYIKEKREENRLAMEQSIKKTEELQLPAAETKTAKEWLELGDKHTNKATEYFKIGDKDKSREEALAAGDAYYRGLKVVKEPYEKSILADKMSKVATEDFKFQLLEGEVKTNTKYSYIYNSLILAYSKYGGTFEQIKETYDKGIASLENNDKLSKEEEDEVRFMLNVNMSDQSLRNSKVAEGYYSSKKAIELLTESNKKVLKEENIWILYHSLAISCIGLKKYDEAFKSLSYIYDDLNIKNNADVLNTFGVLYLKLKDYKKAKEFFIKAERLGSKSAKNNLKDLEKKENSKTK